MLDASFLHKERYLIKYNFNLYLSDLLNYTAMVWNGRRWEAWTRGFHVLEVPSSDNSPEGSAKLFLNWLHISVRLQLSWLTISLNYTEWLSKFGVLIKVYIWIYCIRYLARPTLIQRLTLLLKWSVTLDKKLVLSLIYLQVKKKCSHICLFQSFIP